ncbi:glycosyltransferase family 2 protein [Myxococcota bacterium]|nr:glycosyltransferase family 2 protein [Myxococcota bacterium]
MKRISVVIPLFNEKRSLIGLYAELSEELGRHNAEFEIVFVDDGSNDGSSEILKSIAKEDARVSVIQFRRNFGKSAALSAGFRESTGEVIVTMDADLQDKPGQLGKLLGRLDEGYDLVSGWKRDRKDPVTKRWPSRIFNRVTSWLTGVDLNDINSGFKAYRREVIEEIRVYGEMHRNIPVLASFQGFRVGEVVVEHRARRHGHSKYGVSRFVGGFIDLFTVMMLSRFGSKPLHVFGMLGLVAFLAGCAIEAYLIVAWVLGQSIGDRPLFFLGIVLLILGVQFVFFGFLAEMITFSARKGETYSPQKNVSSRGND